MKAETDVLQDTAESNVTPWFDSYFCSGSAGAYICTAWQPDWMGGLTQGYPRFGPEESSDGELSYIFIDPAATYTAGTDDKTWTIEGATTLAASAMALALALSF